MTTTLVEQKVTERREPVPAPARLPLLSVIMVTWNVRELTLDCLHALFERSGSIPLEVFVVDNASTDGTAAAVRRRFPRVRVIENTMNAGFPRANNQALRLARGEYVLFLNPDTVVGEGALERCLRELEREPTLGMVGCRLVYPDGQVQYECARRAYRLRHLCAELLYLHVLCPRSRVFSDHLMGDWDHRGVRDVEALSGAFMMARRRAVIALGGLPEDFFMYHEDLALSLRLRRAGWGIRCLGDVETLHYGDQSGRQSDSARALLDVPYKLALIREAQGAWAAAVGRGLFGLRSLSRLIVALLATALPLRARTRERYRRLLDARWHWRQLLWLGGVEPVVERKREPSGRIERRARVLVVGATPPPYHGGTIVTRNLLRSPLAHRCELLHLDTSDRRDLMNIGRLDAQNALLAVLHAFRCLHMLVFRRPDLLYVPIAQNRLALWRDALLLLPAQLLGRRTVIHIHGGYFGEFYAGTDPITRRVARLILAHAERVIVLAESLRSMLQSIVAEERVVVVPNGVEDVDAPTQHVPATGSELRVLYLGGLGRSKGLAELLEAAAAVVDKRPEARFMLAGECYAQADQQLLSAAIDRCAGRLEHVGVVAGEAKRELLRSAAVFVFPAVHPEGHPLVVLEAMAAGLPIIATRHAGLAETITDGVNGVLVTPGAPAELAEAVLRLLDSAELRANLGRAARETYLARFTLESWMQHMLSVLNGVAAEARA